MPASFGPWATSMSPGNQVELSTFWKRRMNMLPRIARQNSGSPRTGRLLLIVCSAVLFALPTLLVKAQSPEEAGGKPGSKTTPAASPNKATSALAAGLLQAADKPADKPAVANVAVEFYPKLSKKEEKIATELENNTTFMFTDESLTGISETIMERHKLDIVIDQVKLEEESVAMDATDITLKVNEIPLRSALRLLLANKNLAYIVENDVLKITTKTHADNYRLTRIYPVRDLVGADAADYLSLTDAIRQGVSPGSWKEVGTSGGMFGMMGGMGGGRGGRGGMAAPAAPTGGPPDQGYTISMVPASGSLVIRQSYEGHEEVLRLLRALRMAKNDGVNTAQSLPTY